MKKWLDDCVTTHPGACSSKTVDFIPTRLLDVGTLLEPNLQLRLRHEMLNETIYFTLSHCWGPMVPKRLLLGNLEEFCNGINAQALSRTFQDAIYSTRKLGVQYLWIDSLCIIQDSAEDWQTEAAMMGQVYASGFCNLAATAATEGSQGMFLDKLPPPQVVIDIDGSKDLWHLNENYGYHWGNMLNFAPLNWRGWVFQERFLSARVIHFGRSRIYWECGQKTCCDWPERSTEKDLNSNSWTNQSKSDWQDILSGSATVDKDKAVQMWTAIINHYSSHGAFTFKTDKLLAIGGLASRVQKSTQCRYLAGIWEHNLLPQLMWDVGHGGADDTSVSPYVAPSWSWASIDVPISRYIINKVDYKPSPAVDIHEVDVNLVTDNEFGQVNGGFLVLIGRLGVMQETGTTEDEARAGRIEVRMDRREDNSGALTRPQYLLVIEEQRKDGVFEGAGLVLQYVEDSKLLGNGHVFTRVGFFQFYFGQGTNDRIRDIQDEFDKTLLAKELALGSTSDGKSQYVIKII
ncbi:hypothetical protein EG329_010970 [Mollisiaceae sp. DMI_Dod_QoI]|nr:hypothetical protein EG329_010970 [Helotiales sp. DMI_Dod_QoI]